MVWSSIISAVSAVGNVCRFFFKPMVDTVKIFTSIESNVEQLSREIEFLGGHKVFRLKMAKNMISKDRTRKQESRLLQIWLNQVKDVMKDFEKVKEKHEERPSSWNCFCCGCFSNFDLATEVDRLLKRTIELLEKEKIFTQENMVECVAPEKVKYDLFRFDYEVVGQEQVLKEALDFIEETSVVGIWGMGGVGKTTLLNCIYNKFYSQRDLFAVVIFLTVGRDLGNIIPKIQAEIGKRLGLYGFSEYGDERQQKERIYDSLISRNFLLLVDDLWEPIDHEYLAKIGIPPLHNASEKEQIQKMVVATREKNVCYLMYTNDFIVEMRLLSANESWQLFCKEVGNEGLLKTSEICKHANDIVEKCDHLPLALHHIGKSMTPRKKDFEWRTAILELENLEDAMRKKVGGKHEIIVFNSMVENVLPILKFSYEKLKCNGTRNTLLDLLQRYNKLLLQGALDESMILKTIFGDSPCSRMDKDQILCSLKALVDSSLLMKNPMGLKIHACVYDMLVWLKCTDNTQEE